MNIIHVCDMSFACGQGANGIITVVEALSKAQRECGCNVLVVSISDNDSIKDLPCHKVCDNRVSFKLVINEFSPDLVIFHSLYRLKYVLYADLLVKKCIPYCIEFHGAATMENAQKGRLKKWIANTFLFNRFIKRAKTVIYLNKKEQASSVFSSIAPSSLVIHNGVHVSHEHKKYRSKPKIEFVFLGRIDWMHKGLDFLLDALEIVQQSEWMNRIHFSFYGPLENP